MRRALVGVAVLCVMCAGSFPIAVRADPQAPVKVDGCSQTVVDPVRADDLGVVVNVTFENVSSRPATDVEFEIALYNASGDPIERESSDATGMFSPKKADGAGAGSSSWYISNYSGYGVHEVRCVLSVVRFSDGTVWSRDSAP